VSLPVQLSLFGPQGVHLGHWSPIAGCVVCAMCKVSLSMAGEWSDCDCCPGWVESAPVWTLGGSEAPAGPLPSVAASLEAA